MSPLITTFAGAALRPYGFTLGGAAPAAFELISSQVLTSTATSVTFSSIVGTFKHLQLRVIARSSTGTNAPLTRLVMNSDTAANYRGHYLYGNGSTVASYDTGAMNYIYPAFVIQGSTAPTSAFTGGIMDILDYSDTNKFKTIRSFSGATSGGSLEFNSGLWRSTAAITSLTISEDSGGSFQIGSRFSLYGVKGS